MHELESRLQRYSQIASLLFLRRRGEAQFMAQSRALVGKEWLYFRDVSLPSAA